MKKSEIGHIIKMFLVQMLLITFGITGVYASESTSPSTEIILTVAQDGTEPFSVVDATVDGNGAHTAGLDGVNGGITAEKNGVVRTFDTIRYDIHWNVNDVDSSAANDSSNGVAENVIITMDTGREDVTWISGEGVPARCKNRATALSDGGHGPNTLFTCELGDVAEGTAGTISPVARVGLKADGTPSNGNTIPVTATITTDQSADVTSNQVSTTISSTPKGDWIKSGAEVIYDVDNAGVSGVVLVYPLTFKPGSGTDLRGTEPLDDTKDIQFFDHAWDIGTGAVLITPAIATAIGRKACGGYDGIEDFPYGDDGALPAAAADGIANETNSFNITCTDVSTTYPIVQVDISGQDTTSAPEKTASGIKNDAVVISVQVAFWVPDTTVTARAGGGGVSGTPYWNTINHDNSLDSAGAVTLTGIVPNTEPIQVGTGTAYIDETTIDNNSVNQIIAATPFTVDGETGYKRYRHFTRFFKGPYQEISWIDDANGLEHAGYDARWGDYPGYTGNSIPFPGDGSSTGLGGNGSGEVSRNQILTLHSTVTPAAYLDAVDDPVHLCMAIDNTFMEIIDFPDYVKVEPNGIHAYNGSTIEKYNSSSGEASRSSGWPASNGMAHVLMGDATTGTNANYTGDLGYGGLNNFFLTFIRLNPVTQPAYVVEVSGAAVSSVFGEHGLTCNDSDSDVSGWIASTDSAALTTAFGTGTDIDGNQKYGGITRVRVRMLERKQWAGDNKISVGDQLPDDMLKGIPYSLNLQARVKPDLNAGDANPAPDGSLLRIHASRARGDWNDTTGKPVLSDCLNNTIHAVNDAEWCSLPYDFNNETSGSGIQLDPATYAKITSGDNVAQHTDRVKVVGAKIALTKNNLAGATDLIANDDLVTFQLTAEITGSPAEHFANFFVEDRLDTMANYEYVSHTNPVDRVGNPISGISNCVSNFGGTAGHFRCDFTSDDPYDAGDPNTYRNVPFYAEWNLTVRLINAPGNASIANKATLKGDLVVGGVPGATQKQSREAFAYTGPSYNELFIRKDVPDMDGVCINDPGAAELGDSTLLTGDCSMFAINGQYQYDLSYQNKGSADLTNVVIIDTLPHITDGAEVGNGDGRTPASAFDGTSKLFSVTAAGATVECTTNTPANINRDPSVDASTWTATCDAASTGFRVTMPTLNIGETKNINVVLQTAGNSLNDIYTNSFGARTNEILLATRSNDVSAMVKAPLNVKIGDLVWIEDDNDGDPTTGTITYPAVGTVVTATASDGTTTFTGMTDANGNYLIDVPANDTYTVTVATPAGNVPTVGSTDNNITDTTSENNTSHDGTGTSVTVGTVDNLTVDFGFTPPPPANVKIGDLVWIEDDNDGDPTTGTITYPAVGTVVTATASDGTTTFTGMTDANGNYLIDVPANDTYTVTVATPAGNVPTVGSTDNNITDTTSENNTSHDGTGTSVTVGTVDNLTVDFGFTPPKGSWSGHVSKDTNDDDIGDENLSGVEIKLYTDENGNGIVDGNDSLVGTTTTDANGTYIFTNLDAGDYIAVETQPAGLVDVTENEGGTDGDGTDANITNTLSGHVNVGEEDTGNDFVEEEIGSLSGNVSHEDSNGSHPLKNITIILLDENGVEVSRTTTDENGNYEFTNLVPGKYIVKEEQPDGYFDVRENEGGGDDDNSTATSSNEISATVSSGENDIQNDFVEAQEASLGDYVWYDYDKDGIQDNNEEGVVGVKVYLLDVNGDRVQLNGSDVSTETNSTGGYIFVGLDPLKEYAVEFDLSTLPFGYEVTLEGEGTEEQNSDADKTTGKTASVTLSAGEHYSHLDLGIMPPPTAHIGDFFWVDVNQNGLQDSGEEPVIGAKVELFDTDGNPVKDVHGNHELITDTNGKYGFDVAPGMYQVRFTIPTTGYEGYEFSGENQGIDDGADTDVNGRGFTQTLDVKAGDNILTLDAGINCGCANISTDSTDSLGLLGMLAMMLMTLFISFLFVRKEEEQRA